MVFLFQDQNQGTRNDEHTHTKARAAATVLFHPDFNRRLRIHTESADPSSWRLIACGDRSSRGRRSRAWAFLTLTAGGDFHPALRTSAARNGRPDGEYGQTPAARQAPLAWGNRMSPCRRDRASAFLTSPRSLRGEVGMRSIPGEGRGTAINSTSESADRLAPHPNPLPVKNGKREEMAATHFASSRRVTPR